MKSGKNNILKAWPVYLLCLVLIAAMYRVGQKHPAKHKYTSLGKTISKNISPDKPELTNMQQIIDARTSWQPVLMDWYGKVPADFSFVDIAGKQSRISDFRGKNVILVFWATWSPGSFMEMTTLKKLHDEIASEDLQIIAFSNENPEKLRKFVAEYEINYKVASIQKALSIPFGPPYVKEVPSSFYIDKQGMIKLAIQGIAPLNQAKAILNAEN